MSVAAVGALLAAVVGRAAWRAPARDAARDAAPGTTRSRCRVPAAIRTPLARALRDADVALTAEDALVVAGTGVAVAVLVSAALAPALLPLAVVASVAAGPAALVITRGRARRRFAAALPLFAEFTAARLRSGHTVATALAEAEHAGGAVAGDAARIVRRVELGHPLADALAWWAEERRLDPVRAVAGSLTVAATAGGAAADALDGLAGSLRDQLGARAEALALSAQARMSAVVVGVAPVGYLVFAAAADPGSVAILVTTGAGRACLVLGIVLDLLGAWWMRRIVGGAP